MRKNEHLIEINSLQIEFHQQDKSFIAVDDISFTIGKGEIVGIVGESGSGKSLTALSIMGLYPKEAVISKKSMITLCHQSTSVNLLAIQNKEYRKIRGNEISMIFQEPMTSLNPVQKCGKQVAEVLHIHKKYSLNIKKKVFQLFEEVLLPDPKKVYYSYPHQLSGGQRQRVMIAMALACEPMLLIADEPTTALDVTVQKTILSLLISLQKKTGMSVLFISHDLGVINEICNRVLVMYKGKIVEEFAPSSIPDTISHPYTKGLLACRPPLHSRPAKLLTVSDFINNSNSKIIAEREILIKNNDVNTPLLEIKNLSKFYELKRRLKHNQTIYYKAVDDVSFQLFHGETMGLVGESGCGKTTLSRTILRLVSLTHGQIIFKGKDVAKLGRKELKNFRKQVQIIFQDPYSSLNPLMTIGNALTEPMRVHKLQNSEKDRTKYVIDLLEKVGLSEQAMNKYPHQFSGGQRQRIVIARALVLQPQLIICDEAVSALDVSIQAQVLNLLNDLKKEYNLTYLFISHDWSVVKYMSDRIMVMQKGKIIESGITDDIFYNPTHEYTKTLISSIPGYKKIS